MAAAPPDSTIEANSRLASIPAAAPIATLPARLEFVAPLIEDRQAAKVPLPPTRPDPVRSDMTVALAPVLSDMRERSALQPETRPGSVAQDDNADLKQGIPPAFVALIERHAREAGVDERWMFAVLRAENAAFDAKIISSAGAIGLMQVMPAVGRAYGANDLTDPEQNVRAAARFLRDLFDKYGNPVVVIGAYNAGEPKVDVRAGLPVITETVDYVSRVTSYYYTGGRDNVHPLRRNRDPADAAGDRGDAVRRPGPVNQAEAASKRDVKSISRAERIRQSSIVMNTVDGSASQQGEVR
jgi:soluble lytic murein transglycosylase-like protein